MNDRLRRAAWVGGPQVPGIKFSGFRILHFPRNPVRFETSALLGCVRLVGPHLPVQSSSESVTLPSSYGHFSSLEIVTDYLLSLECCMPCRFFAHMGPV